MKSVNTHKRSLRPPIGMSVVLIALAAYAASGAASRSTTINISVKNSSHRAVAHLYVAVAGDPNNWGPDQLNGVTVPSGASFDLSNIDCGGSGVRVIAEDENGCFVYDNASCEASQTWEITDAATPDCGG